MSLVILYITTFILFLGLDYLGLTNLVKPVFDRHISDLLLEDFRILPAFAFYAFYVAVLLWFVSWPALVQEKTLLWVLGNGALIGALGYGTYEFTNLAVMRDWTWEMVVTDLAWGATLTAVSATGGVYISRLLA